MIDDLSCSQLFLLMQSEESPAMASAAHFIKARYQDILFWINQEKIWLRKGFSPPSVPPLCSFTQTWTL